MTHRRSPVKQKEIVPPSKPLPSRAELEQLYDYVGTTQESMIYVEKNGLAGFIREDGEEVIPCRYYWANDFLEGRAEMVRDGYYGFIDKEGREILEPIYESIDWNWNRGIAKVVFDGYCGLFDRDGNELVPFRYAWMGCIDEDLIVVKEEDYFGYIRDDGTVAIPIVFDDAASFNGTDTAEVVRDGRKFVINRQGEEVL